MPGPLPKRAAERRRRNKVPGETIVMRSDRVTIPALPKDGIHPVARRWYNALKKSGQAEYFEPSDWAAALFVVEAMTKNLETSRFSAQLFAVVWAAMESLLTTESARRKARLEVERGEQDVADEGPTAIDKYRERLAQ